MNENNETVEVNPVGLWHDGEVMLLFLGSPTGLSLFQRAASLSREHRNEILSIVAVTSSAMSDPNDGATGLLALPLTRQVSAFPDYSLVAFAASGMTEDMAENRFSDEQIEKIRSCMDTADPTPVVDR